MRFILILWLFQQSGTVVTHEHRRREEEQAKASSTITEVKKLIAQLNIPEYAFSVLCIVTHTALQNESLLSHKMLCEVQYTKIFTSK
jgi:hypothetical protein